MQFGSDKILFLFLLIPVFVIFLVRSKYLHKRRFSSFSQERFYNYFLGQHSHFFWIIKVILLLLALIFLIFALSKPRWDSESQIIEKRGTDIVICLDISKSMDASDIKPNRLERAKDVILSFLDQLKGDRVSLIVFAGRSFVQSPFTDDYATLKLFVNMQSTDNISSLGTDIGSALEKAIELFGSSKKERIILLISDGEDLQENAVKTAKILAQKGARIYVIGVGTPNGDPITSTNPQGDIVYLKDKQGNIVLSKLDIKTLSEIAENTNGSFFTLTPSQSEVSEIVKKIQSIEKSNYDSSVFVRYKEQYRLFAFVALILLVLEYLIFFKHKKSEQKRFLDR